MNEAVISAPLQPGVSWPAGLSIRARSPADAAGVAALHNMPGYRYGTLRTPHRSVEDIRKGIENQPQGGFMLVALIDGIIVGDIGLTRHTDRRAHVGSIGMGVHDAFQSRGIARALIGEILTIADRWLDLQRIELTVYTDNDRAIRLYERSGFVKEGHLKGFALRDGDYVDAYCMARLR